MKVEFTKGSAHYGNNKLYSVEVLYYKGSAHKDNSSFVAHVRLGFNKSGIRQGFCSLL